MKSQKAPHAFDTSVATASLRAAGLRVTDARLAVLAELDCDLTHPTADDLWDRLNRNAAAKRGPRVSRATVYNCLEALSRIGKIGILAGSSPRRFDPNQDRHFHAVCNRCGCVIDINPELLGSSAPAESYSLPKHLPFRFEVSSVDLRFGGLCEKCSAPGAAKSKAAHVINKKRIH
ncbi:MAG: Fur family transcriptional regulator [Planctomycetota bacterium]